MRIIAWALLLLATIGVAAAREPERRVIHVSTAEELQAALREPLQNATVQLSAGTYSLKPTTGFDSPTTRNCDQNSAVFPVTIGLTISGDRTRLVGPSQGKAILVVNGSYGIFFKDCKECALERVTVTGVQLDAEAVSAYGAVVAKNSSARIAHCVIDYNADDPEWREGRSFPAGICAREGADLVVEFNEMAGNFVGARLFSGSRAVIRNNLFIPSDTTAYGGGIDVSCNAFATVERNLFRGSSGVVMTERADLLCRANLFELGARAIMAGNGDTLRAIIEKNAFYKCSAGFQLYGAVDGRASSNILVENGSGFMTLRLNPAFVMRGNTLYKNSTTDDSLNWNGTREMFRRAQKKWTRTYRNTPVGVDGRHKFHESAFLTRYGRWMD